MYVYMTIKEMLLLSLCRNNAVDFYFTNACRKSKGIHSLMQLEIFLSRLLEFCSRKLEFLTLRGMRKLSVAGTEF